MIIQKLKEMARLPMRAPASKSLTADVCFGMVPIENWQMRNLKLILI